MGTGNDDVSKRRRKAKQPAPEPDPEAADSEDEEPEEARPRRKGSRPLFQDEVVTVTKTRMLITMDTGETVTYAMANVTSVSMFVEPKNFAVVLIGLCSVIIGSAIIGFDRTWGIGFVAVGASLAGIYLFLLKPKFWLRIGTAGAETNAVYSTDASWTKEVVAAVNKAIISRG